MEKQSYHKRNEEQPVHLAPVVDADVAVHVISGSPRVCSRCWCFHTRHFRVDGWWRFPVWDCYWPDKIHHHFTATVISSVRGCDKSLAYTTNLLRKRNTQLIARNIEFTPHFRPCHTLTLHKAKLLYTYCSFWAMSSYIIIMTFSFGMPCFSTTWYAWQASAWNNTRFCTLLCPRPRRTLFLYTALSET